MRRTPAALRAPMFMLGLVLGLALAGTAARADTVTLRGSTIPLKGCEIQDVSAGVLYYRDYNGRRQWRELHEVVAIGFDGLPALDAAEERLRADDCAGAVRLLLRALLEARTDLQELWIRVRLAEAHGACGEHVEAAGHAAAAFLLRSDGYWRVLEPRCKPNPSSYAASKEAIELLERAAATVHNRDLQEVIARLLASVRPVYDERAASYDGPPIAPGSTHSGYTFAQIADPRFTESPDGPDRSHHPVAAPARGSEGRAPGAAAPPGAMRPATAAPASPPQPAERWRFDPQAGADPDDAPGAIDALLDGGRGDDALERCERIAREPGGRDLGRFLNQYGRALRDGGRPDDAAVMFMRAALLYPSSPDAAPSLIETALIYRDVHHRPAVARRLLEMAVRTATEQQQAAVAERARAELTKLRGKPSARGHGGTGPRAVPRGECEENPCAC